MCSCQAKARQASIGKNDDHAFAFDELEVKFTFEHELIMNPNLVDEHCSLTNHNEDDFEFMGDLPKEDPVVFEVNSSQFNYLQS
jgi:hypothetical protein